MNLTDFSQPAPLVIKALADHAPGRVLDIGCAEGRNSVYLARLGWEVVAMDTDEKALGVLAEIAKKEDLNITPVLADAREYRTDVLFDVVLSLMVLHFLSESDIASAMNSMQSWTKPGGVNVVSAFTDHNPAGTRPYMFEPNGLRSFYDGWAIKEYEEALTSGVIPLGETEPRRYVAARLIAERTS